MKENNKKNEEEIQDISKKHLFTSEKFNIPEKDNENIKKKKVKFLSVKNQFFKVQTISEINKKKSSYNPYINKGRWTEDERNNFIQGIVLYGINWKKVKSLIPTRTAVQVRSHAQKFFLKMKECKDKILGIDFSLNSINNIKDMINQIKFINPNYDVINILKRLSNKLINNRRKFKDIHKKNIKNQNTFISQNNNKNELINLEEENKNLISNENAQNLNEKKEKYKQLEINNTKFINNFSINNNDIFSNFIYIGNNNINNNFNNIPNILNNPLPLNGENNLLSNNINNYNAFNNNILNNNLSLNFDNDPYIRQLSLMNNYLFSHVQNLNSINSIGNIFISNLLNQLNTFNTNLTLLKNTYLNNNISLPNNNSNLQNNLNSFNIIIDLLKQNNEAKDKKDNNNQ